MKKEELLKILAPCGLNCKKCLAYNEGEIKKCSSELKEHLGNFESFAKRFASFNPVYENYSAFKEILDVFSQGGCDGCRKGGCINKACNVTLCFKEKNVDFCFECDEFPCENSGFDDNLKQRWIKSNQRMKEIGVAEYYNEVKNLPRYM